MKFFKENQADNLEGAYEKAENFLDENRIDMQDFRKLYGDENVDNDAKHVSDLKQKMAEDNTPEEIEAKKLATIFEVIISEQAELSDWLGPNATTYITTEYDDIVNKVDTIVEITDEEKAASHLGLAIDATYSNLLLEKFRSIKDNISKGKLATIKYFESPSMDFKGKLNKVPRVIVSADPETIKNLIKLWENGDKKALAEHPIQFQILEEILVQLDAFEIYAKKIGKPEIASKFRKMTTVINKIFTDKSDSIEDTGIRDGSLEKIIYYADKFQTL